MYESQQGGHSQPASTVRTEECLHASWGWAHTPQLINFFNCIISWVWNSSMWYMSVCVCCCSSRPADHGSFRLHADSSHDTHKEGSLWEQTNTPRLLWGQTIDPEVTFKDSSHSWKCQQLWYSDPMWSDLIVHELRYETAALLHIPEHNHSTCILIEQDCCHGMKPSDPYFLCHAAEWGYMRRLAPTKAALLLQWCHWLSVNWPLLSDSH